MDTEYLYKWVTIQLDSGILKSEIVNNVMNYAKLNREEAEKYVNDPLYREKFKITDNKSIETDNKSIEIEQDTKDENIISKLSGIENQLKEINKHLDFTYLSLFFIGLGILIGWLIWG